MSSRASIGTSRCATRLSLMRASASIAGKARKKSPRLGDVGERLDGVGGAQAAERLDRVEAHVGVRIVERGDERVDGRRVLLLAEGQRRLHAQVGVGPLQQLDRAAP